MNKAIIFSIGGRFLQGRKAGPHRIASELRKNNWDVEVVDFFNYWTLDELKQLVKSRIDHNTKFIGFGNIFTIWPKQAELLCEWIRQHYPDILIVFGSTTYQNLKSKYIDYYFKGFAEVSFLNFLKYKFSNGDPVEIKKIHGNKIISMELEAAPWRDPSIIYEDRDFLKPTEWISTELSRGCKFKCDFCNFPILGVKGDYTRDADNFDFQLRDTFDRFGVSRYIISDETINDRTDKISKFADVVEKLPFQPFFSGFVRADLLITRGEAEMSEMLRMNLLGQFYGIESFNHETLKSVKKGMHPDKVKQGLLDIRNYFKTHGTGRCRFMLSFIAGLPFETEESMWMTYEWLRENWQGENFMMTPLEIAKPDYNNASLITMDYSKYGYRKMQDLSEAISKTTTRLRDEIVIWENDFTNALKVIELTDKIKEDKEKYDFRLGTFDLSSHLACENLDDLLAFKEADTNNEEANLTVVRNYIHQKLSI